MKKKKHNRKFLNTFFSERKQVGAVAPSSRFLVKKMCAKIDFKLADVILELGPGTGVFTTELLKRAKPDTKIILLELNEAFYELLVKKFEDPRLLILNRSADEMGEILDDYHIKEVDAILSSLPLTIIPERIKKKIVIQSYNRLKEGGVFTQYQYSLSAKRLLESKFGSIKINFVPANIPPAFIYSAKKEKSIAV
ncbi:MAG: rRNA adenine N-6-methyltransferase family protein [Crocinitomicaceae bacterium]